MIASIRAQIELRIGYLPTFFDPALANAELLEARLTDEPQRARAGQVVAGALEAISAIQDLRRIVGLQASSGR